MNDELDKQKHEAARRALTDDARYGDMVITDPIMAAAVRWLYDEVRFLRLEMEDYKSQVAELIKIKLGNAALWIEPK